MSTKPRTPLHFPRMKVRGKRNRAKAAYRLTAKMFLPNAQVVGGGRVALVLTRVVDGFGRPYSADGRTLRASRRDTPVTHMPLRIEWRAGGDPG